MTVRIDEITSEVALEGAPAGADGAAPAPEARAVDLRAALERAARDAERTRAEGYGD